MRRAIPIDSDVLDNDLRTDEGLMYDSTRARSEGLYEELTLTLEDGEGNEYPVIVTEALFEELSKVLGLGVNIEPGRKMGIPLFLQYVYGYGKAEWLA